MIILLRFHFRAKTDCFVQIHAPPLSKIASTAALILSHGVSVHLRIVLRTPFFILTNMTVLKWLPPPHHGW